MAMLDIIDAAETVIQAAINASSTHLGDVEKILKGGAVPPRPQNYYPLIIIGAQAEEREHKRAARAGGNPSPTGFGERYRWFIAITQTLDNLTDSFEKVCNIWEELKTTVDNNYTWSATVDDTNYDGPIQYGAVNPFTGEERSLTYTILVNLISNVRWGQG